MPRILHTSLSAAATLLIGASAQDQLCPEGYWCGEGEGYAWSSKGGGVRHSGASPNSAPWDLYGGPSWSWKNETGVTIIRASPLIDDQGYIYLTTVPGTVIKFSPDGQVVWSYQAEGAIPDTPVLYKGNIYGNTDRGNIWAVDMSTGEEVLNMNMLGATRWDSGAVVVCEGVLLSKGIKPKPLMGYDSIFKQGGATRLIAMDASTGVILWEYHTDTVLYSANPICGGDGGVVIQDHEGGVYKLSLQDGRRLWKAGGVPAAYLDIGTTTASAILGPNNIIYSACNRLRPLPTGGSLPEGVLKAYRLEDGQLLWDHGLGNGINSAPAVAQMSFGLGLIVPLGHNPPFPDGRTRPEYNVHPASIAIVDANDGTPRGYFEGSNWQGPATGDMENEGLRLVTLGFEHQICAPSAWTAPSAGADGAFYIGFQSGHIYAIRDLDGNGWIDPADPNEVSSYDARMAFQGAPAIGEGVMAIASCDELLVFRA